MKKILTLTAIIAVMFQSCMREEVHTSQNKVQVDINLQNDVGTASTTAVKSVLIRISDSQNDIPVDTKIDAIVKNGSVQPVEFILPSGNYKIEDVFVLDDQENVIYAAPRKNSEIALRVLHKSMFSVSSDTRIQVTTISTANKTSQAFGYKTFKKDKGTIKIVVNNPNGKPTTAIAYILQGGDTIGSYQLKAKINTIQFTGDKTDSFTIVVVKDGFGKHSAEYTYDDFKKSCNKAIVISLEKALTFRFHTLPSFDQYRLPIIFAVGTMGNLRVDWGDGIIENYSFQSDEITHVYQVEGDYFLSLTGDVEKINEVFGYNYDFEVTYYAINLEHLKSLRFTEFGWISAPPLLDLSHSKDLYGVDLEDLANLKTLLLPKHHDIRYFVIEERTGLTAEAISNIVTNIHSNAVAKNIQNGYLDFRSYSTPVMVGPPSAEAIEKLKFLRDSLQWNILPNP